MKRNTKLLLLYIFTCIFITISLFSNYRSKSFVKTDYYDIQVQSANRMSEYTNAIKRYKNELDIPIFDYDIHNTGLLGEEFNMITTSLGNLEAKRSSANPDMAALVVRIFKEAGLNKGDHVGVALTGSFPAINIAVFSACDVMELDMTIIASAGASTYGTNHYNLTFPEIIDNLYKDNILSPNVSLVTLGGDFDTGYNIPDEIKIPLIERYSNRNFNFIIEEDFYTNVQIKISNLESKRELDAFVAVGGNSSFKSKDKENLPTSQGLLTNTNNLNPYSAEEGLINYYLNKNIPTIYFLNIEKLFSDYNMAFDPEKLSPIGESPVYYEYNFNKPAIIVTILSVCIVIGIFHIRKGPYHRKYNYNK